LFLIADIVVVDWQVNHPDGTNSTDETVRFLKSAVAKGLSDTPQQRRLIVVYTGTDDLLEVSGKIEECLRGSAGNQGNHWTKIDDFTFQINAIRIVILGKPSNKRALNQRDQQVSDDSKLCERAIEDFADMSAGLVSNVALDSLAQVRRSTHGLLTRFGPHLDAAFLAHRALLTPPEEGNQHLIPLIVSELQAIIEDKVSDCSSHLSDECISQWLDTRPNDLPDLANAGRLNTEDKKRQAVKDICLKGVNGHEGYSIPSEPNWIRQIKSANLDKLTNVIAGEVTAEANEKLELLMSLRPRYTKSLPMLTLGTVLRSELNNSQTYWICLQPSCDCYIRDSDPLRAFPFLRVAVAASDKFNLIVEDDGVLIRLAWDAKPYLLQMFAFQSNSPLKTVVATSENNKPMFSANSHPIKFHWIAELKFPQAQRIAQTFASQTARVGLTESEWLRRKK
jgi:hypothetical protein